MNFIRDNSLRFLLIFSLLSVLIATASAGHLKVFWNPSTTMSPWTQRFPDNGDLNPYAIVVAPVSSGNIQKGDVLVDNFNDISNLQGTGTTIVDYRSFNQTYDLVCKSA